MYFSNVKIIENRIHLNDLQFESINFNKANIETYFSTMVKPFNYVYVFLFFNSNEMYPRRILTNALLQHGAYVFL